MTSEIRTNSLTSRAGLSTVTMTDSGPMFSGITTFVDNSGFTFGVGGGTSIFTPATNVLTFGTNNTEKIRIDANGHMHGVGVITATHFYGDGSNLTGISAGTSLSGSTNNTVCTVTGANAIQGESNFTWTGSALQVTAGTGNQFPFNLRNDFTPNSQRADLLYAFNGTSNNVLRIGSINSNGGITLQSTRANDSSVKHNLILQPDGGNIGAGGITSPLWTSGGGIHLNDNYGIGFGNGGSGRPDFQLMVTDGSKLEFRCGFGADTADIVMDTSGRLLVGTTSQSISSSELFEVKSSASGFSHFRNNSSTYAPIYIDNEASNNGATLVPIITVTDGGGNRAGFLLNNNNQFDITGQGSVTISTGGGVGNATRRVRINSTGLLIGTDTAVRALTIKDPGQIHVESTANGNWVGMSIKGSSGTNNYNAYFGVLDSNGKFFVDNGSNGDDIIIESSASGQKQGRVLVGPSVPTSGDDSQVIIRNNESQGIYRCLRLNNQSNNNRITMTFEGGNTQTGDIRINGSTTSYNSYSDYRLKENVVPLTDPITRLKTLKPYRFNFIASPDITLDGFFAHEVSPAVAEAVGGEKDKVDTDGNVVPQALDMAKLVPLLTASLQEAITRIETLEQENIALRARVTNLEGQ